MVERLLLIFPGFFSHSIFQENFFVENPLALRSMNRSVKGLRLLELFYISTSEKIPTWH